MSWDIFISKVEVKNLQDGDLAPISDKDNLIKNLNTIVPNINYTDNQWGVYKDEDCSITFNIGDEEEDSVNHLMLYIRGGGDTPIAIIQSICNYFGCYAMDCSTGEQMSFDDNDQNSFKEWQNYRDKVLGK